MARNSVYDWRQMASENSASNNFVIDSINVFDSRPIQCVFANSLSNNILQVQNQYILRLIKYQTCHCSVVPDAMHWFVMLN